MLTMCRSSFRGTSFDAGRSGGKAWRQRRQGRRRRRGPRSRKPSSRQAFRANPRAATRVTSFNARGRAFVGRIRPAAVQRGVPAESVNQPNQPALSPQSVPSVRGLLNPRTSSDLGPKTVQPSQSSPRRLRLMAQVANALTDQTLSVCVCVCRVCVCECVVCVCV